MIRAEFFSCGGTMAGFSISGHADYSDDGVDIVCACVSSAVQMTANGITEVLSLQATVTVKENAVSLSLKEQSAMGDAFISALKLHLSLLSEDYPQTINIINSEV